MERKITHFSETSKTNQVIRTKITHHNLDRDAERNPKPAALLCQQNHYPDIIE